MNCCDEFGDCRQGRDCPVRRSNQVAPIGRSYPRVIPTQPTAPQAPAQWRHLAKWLGIYLLLIALTVALLGLAGKPRTKAIDCSIAEFHPDVPQAIKDQCRKLRSTTV